MTKVTTKSSVSTFSIPHADGDRIDRVRLRFAQLGHLLNRSEVVRLGLIALEDSSPEAASVLVNQLDRKLPGRPAAVKRKSK